MQQNIYDSIHNAARYLAFIRRVRIQIRVRFRSCPVYPLAQPAKPAREYATRTSTIIIIIPHKPGICANLGLPCANPEFQVFRTNLVSSPNLSLFNYSNTTGMYGRRRRGGSCPAPFHFRAFLTSHAMNSTSVLALVMPRCACAEGIR